MIALEMIGLTGDGNGDGQMTFEKVHSVPMESPVPTPVVQLATGTDNRRVAASKKILGDVLGTPKEDDESISNDGSSVEIYEKEGDIITKRKGSIEL